MLSFPRCPHGPRKTVRARVAGVLLAGVLLASPSSAQILTNTTELHGEPLNGEWSDPNYFGDSVAVSGDTLVAGTSAGKDVYVFRRGAGGWSLESKLTANFSNTRSSTVTLDGDTLVVADEVYVRSGTTWTKQFTIPSPGYAVALKGDRLVVGNANEGYDGSFRSEDGAVYVYLRSGTTWTLEAKLQPDLPRNEGMGYTVAFDGSTIVAGSEAYGGNGAYVFTRVNGSWQQQARLLYPSSSGYGWSVAVSGDWIALPEPTANFVHLFRRTSGSWAFAQTVGASDSDRSYFGAEVALKDGVLAVLAERTQTYPSYQITLAGYLFTLGSSGWTQAQRVDRAGDAVWGSLGLENRCMVLGNGNDRTVAGYRGAATVYDTPAPPAPGGGWRGLDVGAVGIAGTSSGGTPAASVSGSGADIWGPSDAFHFHTETMTGDGAIVARVASLTNTHGFAKAGIMFREDVSPSAREVMMLATPENNISFQYRADRAGDTQFTLAAYGVPAAWLKLTRSGNLFSGYRSNDGVNWALVGTATIELDPTIHVGLAVTSHNVGALATGTFDNVALSGATSPPPPPPPPPGGPWTGADIGPVGIAGSESISGANLSVRGAGADIWGAQDAFHFTSQTLAGDGALVVHLGGLQNTHGWAKAGLMLRDGAAANARNVMILARPDQTVSFQYRLATGGESAFVMGSWNLSSVWLMLTRAGDTFDGYESTDGTTWRKVGSVTIAMPASLLAGLAVTSHDDTKLTTAVFDNFDLVNSSSPPPPPSGGDWQTAKIGDGVAGSWSLNNDVFTVSGSGSDVWGTNDNFRFVYRALDGDGEIVARVAGLMTTADTNPIMKAGLMLRSSLDPGAGYSFVFITPRALVAAEGRSTIGESATRAATAYDRFIPQWLKLVRAGNTVTTYASEDRTLWTQMAAQTVVAGSTVYVGLAVCAHDATRAETATFDYVTVATGEAPAAWLGDNIGGAAGSSSIGASAVTVNSASRDIWDASDAFTFVHRSWHGDGEFITRVDGLTDTSSWAKAGLMFRGSLAGGSPHAFVLVTPEVGVSFQSRATASGESTMANHTWGPAAPWWLRLVRAGNTFTAYDSPDGVTWRSLGTQTVVMAADVYVGFAVTSHNSATSASATFTQFSIH